MDIFNEEYKRRVNDIEEDAAALLEKYAWPGNVRELRNIILRAMISAGKKIGRKELPVFIQKGMQAGQEIRIQTGSTLPEIERLSIIKTLQMAKGNKLKAAEILGISRRSLYNKLEEYNIDEQEYS